MLTCPEEFLHTDVELVCECVQSARADGLVARRVPRVFPIPDALGMQIPGRIWQITAGKC